MTLPHSAVRKHAFMVKSKESSNNHAKKNLKRKKFSLELMHHRLGHRSTRSLISGDTANVWEDAKLQIDADPFLNLLQNFLNQQKG